MRVHTCLVQLKLLSVLILVLLLSNSCDQPGVVQSTPSPSTGLVGMPVTPQPGSTELSSTPLSKLTQKWKIKPGDHLDTTPVVVNDAIYATFEDTCICAFDAETGQTNWEISPPGVRLTSPTVANGLVYVGMYGDWQLEPEIKQTSYLYAFDARTGDGRWRFQGDSAEDESASQPAAANGLVYVGTGHADGTGITPPAGLVTALDGATGKVVWQIKTSGSEQGGIAVGDGMVFFGDGVDYDYQTDHLHAVDAKTGKEIWTQDVSPQLGSLPLVHNNLLYIGGSRQLKVLDTQTGQEKWHASLPADSFSSPNIADGTLYFASNEQRDFCIDNCAPKQYTYYISAIDANTGTEKWKATFNDGGPFNDLAMYDGVLYYNTFRPNFLKALDAKTGNQEWQFEASDAIFGSPAVANGVIYLGISDGHLYALLPPGSLTSALTPKPAPSLVPSGSITPIVPVADVQEAPARGFRAPNFTLTEVGTSKQITLSDLRGRPVFLNFWATWCPPCKEEMPRIENMYAKYKGQVEFIGISSSSSDDLQKVMSFINEGKFSWTFLDDRSDSVGSRYQAVSYPTSFFVGRDGLIRAIHIGEMEQADIEANLESVK